MVYLKLFGHSSAILCRTQPAVQFTSIKTHAVWAKQMNLYIRRQLAKEANHTDHLTELIYSVDLLYSIQAIIHTASYKRCPK